MATNHGLIIIVCISYLAAVHTHCVRVIIATAHDGSFSFVEVALIGSKPRITGDSFASFRFYFIFESPKIIIFFLFPFRCSYITEDTEIWLVRFTVSIHI